MSTPASPPCLTNTHEVTNQPPVLEDYNLYDTDVALVEALRREGGGWAESQVRAYGAALGSPEVMRWGRDANRNIPQLHTHDRFGHRIDEIEFHPAWHEIMRLGMAHEVHNLPWRNPQPGAHVARAAKVAMHAQIESGSSCPLTMTFASLPALRHQENVLAEWEEPIMGSEYDPRVIPAAQKSAVLIGMAMTEKQGGSDVRTNTTRATAIGAQGPGEAYELVGHKWFCSAPMCDAFLTLAQSERGLSCFLAPRFRPDGTRNPLHIQQLKDKLGNRSNASSEIEYPGTWARMVGEEGRGVRTIIEMVQHTRLDCVSSSAGIMRQALAQAAHHATHRTAFGRKLREQPLMRNVLADLALESEAATALMMRLSRSVDASHDDDGQRAFARIAIPVSKFWVCKRAPQLVYEAMECLGGNGYVEDSILPRLYREAPVNAIWEGSGNVVCLDVLRAMTTEPDVTGALLDELRSAAGGDRRLDARAAELDAELSNLSDAEPRARHLVEKLAIALQASILIQHAPTSLADAFCESRLEAGAGRIYGTLPASTPFGEIIDRTAPKTG